MLTNDVWTQVLILAGALCLAATFEYFHRRYGQRYLRLWALSWAASSLHLVVDTVQASRMSLDATVLECLRLLGMYAHCKLLVWGLYEAGTGLRARPWTIRLAHGLTIVLSVLPLTPFADPLLVSAGVAAAVTGTAYVVTGVLVLRWLGGDTVGALGMAIGFFVYGILQAIRLTTGDLAHPIQGLDLLANLLVEILLALALIIWLLERTKVQAVQATADFHRAQEASLRRFRRLLERGWDLVELRKPDGELEWVSQSVERVLEIPVEDYLAAPRFYYVHPHDRAAMRRLLVGDAKPLPVPIRMTDGRGGMRRMEAVAMDLTSDPEVGAIVVTSRDVSDRYDLQRALLDASGRERRVLGRRLHDGLGQVLTGVGFKVAQLESMLERDPGGAIPVAREIKTLVKMAVTQAESLARGLSPVAQRVEGLTAALESLGDMARRLYGVECTVGPVTTEGLDHEVASQLYLIAEEALFLLVSAHGASSLEVDLRTWEDGGALRVTGRGCGGGPTEGSESVVRSRMRIRLMEYRASAIDASVDPILTVEDSRTIRCRFRTDWAATGDLEAG